MQVTLLTLLFSGSLSARELPPPAYQLAARQADIPSAVLYAVTLQESGIRLRGKLIPWPWTLNVAGIPERYSNRIEACVGLQRALKRVPAKRVDVGLGQINVGYQSQHFDHPCELLNPYRNLKIAATLLREQHVPGENWVIAIGRYHRPAGGAPAESYRRSVQKHLARVLGNGTDASLTLTKVSSP
ncbi:lytic transglycosylase domain-containing protein [Serratia fonticola]|uniref:lytic transglycosylase domain-containing protein n=1 Tax=Serratia fonticola TaxID=47917 RepID=UPI001ED8FEC5|nr:lytic transglycosylase domain-containing protein [Serratia fonticola]